MSAGPDDYEVGYRRPPKSRQFRPGQSGNRAGRPAGAKNFATEIQKALEDRVSVTEGGKRRSISKRKAIAIQLVNRAASGDPRALPILLSEARSFESQETGERRPGPPMSLEDQRVMAGMVSRIRQAREEGLPEPERSEPEPDAAANPDDKEAG
jgi:Family of unknown function (DUF5681)